MLQMISKCANGAVRGYKTLLDTLYERIDMEGIMMVTNQSSSLSAQFVNILIMPYAFVVVPLALTDLLYSDGSFRRTIFWKVWSAVAHVLALVWSPIFMFSTFLLKDEIRTCSDLPQHDKDDRTI